VKGTVASAGSEWYIEVVDSEGDVGQYSSIPARDCYPLFLISYYDKTNGDLKGAAKPIIIGGITFGWEIQVVDSEGDVGLYTSCDFRGWGDETDGGIGSIAYYDKTNGDLKYAKKTIPDGEWEIQVVDSQGDVGLYSSLSLDSDGNPHIAYYDKTNDKLKYATSDGESWDITVIADGGKYCSMALTSDGRPYIAYTAESDTTLDKVKFAWICGLYGEWYYRVVDSSEEIYGVSIAVDSSDTPYIGYYACSGDAKINVNVANGNVYSWTFTIETVDEVESEEDSSVSFLSLDYWDDENDGGIGICYAPQDMGYVIITFYYAYKTFPDGEWEIQVVESEGDVGKYSSLCIVDGRAVIAYYDATNGDLKRAIEGVPSPPTIDGPTNGQAGTEYVYYASDGQADDLWDLIIDWSDETTSEWMGPYEPEEEVEVSHIWEEQGEYTIKAKVRDILGAESEWATLEVSMPNTKSVNPFELFLENHPTMFPLLRLLMMLQ